MRCKSCFRTFSQPGKITKETQICSICRGTKTSLKNRSLCEKSPQFLINPGLNSQKKYVNSFEVYDQYFIEHLSRKKVVLTPLAKMNSELIVWSDY